MRINGVSQRTTSRKSLCLTVQRDSYQADAASSSPCSRRSKRLPLKPGGKHASVDRWLRHLLASDHLDHLHTAPMFGVLFAEAHRLQFDAQVSTALQRSVACVADTLAGILRRGQREASIRADVPPLTLAWLVVSLIQARQFRRSYSPEPSPVLEADLLARNLETFRPRPLASTTQ